MARATNRVIEAPRGRVRVIERGRRLEVIDTRGGRPAPALAPSGDPLPGAARAVPERAAFDGRAVLVTRAFYDLRGPRRLMLDPDTAQMLRALAAGAAIAAILLIAAASYQPLLLVLLAIPAQPRV